MSSDTVCVITIGGQAVSTVFYQFLERVSVSDRPGYATDTASITLDDSTGQLIMPQIGAAVNIQLGDQSGVAQVFDGTVNAIRSAGSAGGGRQLTIECKGFDPKGKAKEPLEFHKDDCTLAEFMHEAASKAGLTFRASERIAGIKRDWWGATTESFLQLGARLAEETGGRFKIKGKQAVIHDRNVGQSLSGAALTGVTAAWGINLLTWDMSPQDARPRFEKTRTRWYDMKEAKWKEETVEVQQHGPASDATFTHRQPRFDKDEAKDAATDDQKSSERERGGGSVTILGNPSAQPEGTCVIVGARPGIDGAYKIDGVTHDFSASGYTTKLDLKHPEGEAGSDTRSAA